MKVSGRRAVAGDGGEGTVEVADNVPQPWPDATRPDLDRVIDQLVTGLTEAIERTDHPAASRAIAFHVLSGWLRTNRRWLSDPAKGDNAETLIRSALHPDGAGLGSAVDVDVSVTATAAEQLAVILGDDFPMAMVWIAAGLDAQLA